MEKEEKDVATLSVEENGEVISETRNERAAHHEEMRIVSEG
jgi:hypothetical protein